MILNQTLNPNTNNNPDTNHYSCDKHKIVNVSEYRGVGILGLWVSEYWDVGILGCRNIGCTRKLTIRHISQIGKKCDKT